MVDRAAYKPYYGHSSHVVCIRFSPDDKWVISAGGHDRGLFQFKTEGIAGAHVTAAAAPSLLLMCPDVGQCLPDRWPSLCPMRILARRSFQNHCDTSNTC